MLPQTGNGAAVQAIGETARAMRAVEEKLFLERTRTADQTQQLASIVTVAGSGFGDCAGRPVDLPGPALVARPR